MKCRCVRCPSVWPTVPDSTFLTSATQLFISVCMYFTSVVDKQLCSKTSLVATKWRAWSPQNENQRHTAMFAYLGGMCGTSPHKNPLRLPAAWSGQTVQKPTFREPPLSSSAGNWCQFQFPENRLTTWRGWKPDILFLHLVAAKLRVTQNICAKQGK
jgi:hypothetical protein